MKKDRSAPSVRLTVGQKWADAYIKISKGENIYAHSNKFMYGVCHCWTNNALAIVL